MTFVGSDLPHHAVVRSFTGCGRHIRFAEFLFSILFSSMKFDKLKISMNVIARGQTIVISVRLASRPSNLYVFAQSSCWR